MDPKFSPREGGVPSSPASHHRTGIPEPLKETTLLRGKCMATPSKLMPSCSDGDRRNHKSHTPTQPRSTLHPAPNIDPILFPCSSTQRKTRSSAPVSSLRKALSSRKHLSSGWRGEGVPLPQDSTAVWPRPGNPQGRSSGARQAPHPGPPRPMPPPTEVSLPSRHECFSHLLVTPLVTVQFPQPVTRHGTPGSGQMQPPAT